MTKKRGIDQRQEGGSARSNRVDRVFVPALRTTRPPATEIAAELLATSRTPTVETGTEAEMSLRRQLSRLQRQLADSQCELANKDDELAAEVERRLETARELDQERDQVRQLQTMLDELTAYRIRTEGMEQRLQDAIATSDELVQVNERERVAAAAAQARIDELTTTFEETRALWNAERKLLEERTTAELATLDAQRKAAVEASAEALNAQAARLRETHEAELAAAREAYEQSLATLRGDLEPKAQEAHLLAEERERLIAEITAVRNEAMRDVVEMEESHKLELAQLADAHAADRAAAARTHAAELARLTADRDEHALAREQATKAAETREQALEGQAEALRQLIKNVQREVAEQRERVVALETDRKSVDDTLDRKRAEIEALVEDKRAMQAQLDAAANDLRRAAQERHRFVAYLEEGLAFLGALPPKPDPAPES